MARSDQTCASCIGTRVKRSARREETSRFSPVEPRIGASKDDGREAAP